MFFPHSIFAAFPVFLSGVALIVMAYPTGLGRSTFTIDWTAAIPAPYLPPKQIITIFRYSAAVITLHKCNDLLIKSRFDVWWVCIG